MSGCGDPLRLAVHRVGCGLQGRVGRGRPPPQSHLLTRSVCDISIVPLCAHLIVPLRCRSLYLFSGLRLLAVMEMKLNLETAADAP